MSVPLHNQIEQAYANFERQRAALAAIQDEAAQDQTSVTSKNRAVTVTVDHRGAVTAIRFPTTAYRTMAAGELANLLVETIDAARSQAADQTIERFRAVLPAGLAGGELIGGNLDLDAMMARAARFINDQRFDDLINGRAGERNG